MLGDSLNGHQTLNENLSYDNRGRLTSKSVGSVYSFGPISYAPDSNILGVNDSANGNWTYAYDDFNRLFTSSQPGQGFRYDYDRYGNRWNQALTAGGGPTPSYSFDANNHIAAGVTYDAAGNMTFDGANTYVYDAEGRIQSVSNQNSGVWSYIYDVNGRRVRRTNGSNNWDYIYDTGGQSISMLGPGGVLWNEDFYAGGRQVATYANNSTFFNHSDWLGSERVRTDPTGGVGETCTSLPFGDLQQCTPADYSPKHFTGKERDSETGLDYFGARYYGSTMGRWLSADWNSVPVPVPYADIRDPQSLNLYSYVRNNPLSKADADGHDIVDYNCMCAPNQATDDGHPIRDTLVLGGVVVTSIFGGEILGGARALASSLLTWAYSNPDKIQRGTEVALDLASPPGTPSLSINAAAEKFGFQAGYESSGSLVGGQLRNGATVSAIFERSASGLNIGISFLHKGSATEYEAVAASYRGAMNVARAEGLSSVKITAISPSEKLLKSLLKNGFQEVMKNGKGTGNYFKVLNIR